MNVAEAAVDEFARQGVAEVLSIMDFDPMALARVVIKAADGDVIQLPNPRAVAHTVMAIRAPQITRSAASRSSLMPWFPRWP
jgi:hypothetical protein